MANPWLSLLMPTYQGARYIAASLSSVERERDPNVEIIVVDDGSTDETLDIVQGFAKRIPIRIVLGPRKKSWVASTNVALASARAPHVGFLHQDDGYREGRLAKMRSAIEAYPSARFLLHPSDYVDVDGARIGRWGTPLGDEPSPLDPSYVMPRLLVQNFVSIPAPIVRTEDLRAIGGFDESLWYTADWDAWLRIAALGPTVYIDEPLAFFRVHGESQTVKRSGDANAFRAQMSRVIEAHRDSPAIGDRVRSEVVRAAYLSTEVNVALATVAHGSIPSLWPLARTVPGLSPAVIRRFLRDSRIVDRLGARLRTRLVA